MFAFLVIVRTIRRGEHCGEQIAALHRSGSDDIARIIRKAVLTPTLQPPCSRTHSFSPQADIIVRAAVIGEALSRKENEAKKRLRILISEVRNRSIHVPSALRLLRLLCAKRCERGPNCFAYNLKTGLSSAEGLTYSQDNSPLPFGLALCATCRKDVGHKFWNRVWFSWDDKGRICIHPPRWGSRVVNFARAEDVLTTANGEMVGPIIGAKDISQIAASHNEATARKDAYGQLLIECYGEEDSEERASYERRCTELVILFDAAETEIATWLLNRQNKKQAEARAKHDEAMGKKRENLKPILAALVSLVADLPLKELALDYSHRDSSSEAVWFRYFFMRDTMGSLIRAPSSATPKVLAATLTAVKRKLTILSNSDAFFDLSFLTSAIEACTESREKRVLQKLLDEARPYVHSMKPFLRANRDAKQDWNRTTDRFFDLLEQQEFTTALLHVMEARNVLKFVASAVLVSYTSSMPTEHRSLVRHVFEKVEQVRPRATDGTLPAFTLSSFQSTLASVRSEFRSLKTLASAYLNHQPVRDWVQGNDNDHVVAENILARRRSAINNVWSPRTSVLNHRNSRIYFWIWHDIRSVTPYQLLLNQDFDRLLRIHKFYMGHSPLEWHYVPGASN